MCLDVLQAMDAASSNDYPADGAYNPYIVDQQTLHSQDDPDNTAIQTPAFSHNTSTPPIDQDPNQRYNSPGLYPQPTSRPDSGMSGQQQTQYQQENRPQPANKSSVVIKVGMVGDAQIGKTSLMVKYVEGSWDEDYIQTLGAFCHLPCHPFSIALLNPSS